MSQFFTDYIQGGKSVFPLAYPDLPQAESSKQSKCKDAEMKHTSKASIVKLKLLSKKDSDEVEVVE